MSPRPVKTYTLSEAGLNGLLDVVNAAKAWRKVGYDPRETSLEVDLNVALDQVARLSKEKVTG